MREYFPVNQPKIYVKDDLLEIVTEDPKTSYYYSLNCIQAPFPEGELAIARSGKWSYRYAINILKARFQAGEKAIKRSAYADSYKAHFGLECF